LGDTVLLADVGNSRIKLAMVSDHGIDASGVRRLPTVAVGPRAGQPLDGLVDQAGALGVTLVVLDVADHLHEVSATAVRAGRDEWRAVG
jgi:hypothetical protein